MEQISKNKKDLVVLDFDDTIYYNSRKNYTVDINFDDILHLLRLKGYNISGSYFINIQDYESIIDETTFLINYWSQKDQLIHQLRISGKYRSITVIDDDSVICSMLSRLNYDIIQAKLFVLDMGLQILFTRLNSALYNSLSIDLDSNIKIKGDV